MTLHPQAVAAARRVAAGPERRGHPASSRPTIAARRAEALAAAGAARGRRRGRGRRRRRRAAAGSTAPDGATPSLIVHLHGGGFVFNDVDVHDAAGAPARQPGRAGRAQRRLPAAAGAPVPGRARRRRHGAGLAARERRRPRARPGPTYVHGDSAGGNLALVAALRNPGALARCRAHLPVPRPDGGGASYAAAPTAASTRARRRGTGSSTPATPDDLTTPTSRRCSPTARHAAADAGPGRRARPARRRGRELARRLAGRRRAGRGRRRTPA